MAKIKQLITNSDEMMETARLLFSYATNPALEDEQRKIAFDRAIMIIDAIRKAWELPRVLYYTPTEGDYIMTRCKDCYDILVLHKAVYDSEHICLKCLSKRGTSE